MQKNKLHAREGMRARLRAWGEASVMLSELTRERNAAWADFTSAQDAADAIGRKLDAADRYTSSRTRAALKKAQAFAASTARAYLEAARRLDAEIAMRNARHADINAGLAKLSDGEQMVLRLRYGRHMSWVAVARRMNYCDANVRRMESIAIDNMRQFLGG